MAMPVVWFAIGS